MNRKIAKEQIRKMLSTYLDTITVKKGNKYICPICGSGSGNNNHYTPAFSVNGEKWRCFSCNNGGDIFSLIALQNGLDSKKDFHQILDIASASLNISVNNSYNAENMHSTYNKQNLEYKLKAKIDYNDFLKACKDAVCETDYYRKRGIEADTIERFDLGYLTSEIIENYRKTCNLPAYIFNGDIIIPYNKNGEYWIARDTITLPNAKNKKYLKWKKPKSENAGREPIYNEAELDNKSLEPIFITEAPLDSISIMQAGGVAIAIGGTGQDKIKEALDKRPDFNRSFIIAFDNPKQDKAGETATKMLKEILKKRKINYITFEFKDGIKDCNAYLMDDKNGFYKSVNKYIEKSKQDKYNENEHIKENYNKGSEREYLKKFISNTRITNTSPIPTGFTNLDKELDGGLYEGLYVVGATSSLGKTTLVLQIANQIAQSGRDILFFSLEIGVDELIAKTISQETFRYCKKENLNTAYSKTFREIMDNSRYCDYNDTEQTVIKEAIKTCSSYADNIFIKEGLGDINVLKIKEDIEKHKKAREKTPIVIIDYLQVLAPFYERNNDKQNTDKAVLELKKISRYFKTPVLAISSFNRDNYTSSASMAAFKESGAIEYSSDVLVALQPQGMKEGVSDIEKGENKKIVSNCKLQEVRPIEAVILKNRNGATGGKVYFNYYASFNYYEEGKLKVKKTVSL